MSGPRRRSDIQGLRALAVLVVVQQVESNLITPLIANRMVSIAPAVGLFAGVAMGVLFGLWH